MPARTLRFAQAVCARLEEERIRCWMAPRDIRPGADWQAEIVAAIRSARAVVLVFSAHANASAEVRRGVALATKHGLSVITFRIEDVAPTGALDYTLHSVHWLDALTPPVDGHIRRLYDALRPILDFVAQEERPTPAAAIRSKALRLLPLVPVFAATGWAMSASFDVEPCGDCGRSSWPHFRAAGLFGAAFAVPLVRSWAERLLVAALAIPVYYGAQVLTLLSIDTIGGFAFVLGAVVGALAMTALSSIWNRPLLRGWSIAAAAALAAGCVFAYLPQPPYREGFVSWHILVGGAVVEFAGRQRAVPERLAPKTLWSLGAGRRGPSLDAGAQRLVRLPVPLQAAARDRRKEQRGRRGVSVDSTG